MYVFFTDFGKIKRNTVLTLLQVSNKCLKKVFSMIPKKIMNRNVFYTGK